MIALSSATEAVLFLFCKLNRSGWKIECAFELIGKFIWKFDISVPLIKCACK
jgi:hypothetical protein